MKRKKRRLGSNGSNNSESSDGFAMQKTKKSSHDQKIHVMSIFDELDDYLAPYTPEIQRWKIPAPAPDTELLQRADFCSNNVPLNPGASGGDLVEACGLSGDGNCGLLDGLDLILSPEGLKGPGPDFVEGLEKLLEVKFGIMAMRIRHGLDAWALGSHMVNPFEVLSFVAAASPLNRAFFKMWELIQTFQFVPSVSKKQSFLSAHLCEGPGGFIEAVLEHRASSFTSEDHLLNLCTAVDGELRTKNCSSSLADKTQAHRKSRSDNLSPGSLRSSKLDSGNEQLSCRSIVSNESVASDCLEDFLSTELDEKVVSPRSRSGSQCAAESSKDQVTNTMPKPGCPRTSLPLKNGSSTQCNAESTQLLELGRVGQTTPNAVDGRDALRGPMTPNHSAAVQGEDSSNNNSRNLRKTSMEYHDLWFGLTLASTQQCAAGGSLPPPMMEMSKLNEKVGGNSEGHLHYGVDGSGDLTSPANLNAFVEYTLSRSDGQRMDLITADGAFDVSEDFSSQEHSHLNLVFCEVVAALRLQAKGGSFVLKLFDCYTASTLSILFMLSSLYRNVEIVRLRTTRVCNSERYVVAEGFRGLSPQLEITLMRLNEEWNIASNRGDKVGLLLSGGFPDQLLQAVMASNAVISAMQINGINRALQLADVIGERLPPSDSFGMRKGSISMLRRKLQTHKRMQSNAIALCKALNIPCRSQFCM